MTPTNEAAERLRELANRSTIDGPFEQLLEKALAFERQATEAAPSPDPIRAAVEAEWYNGNLSEDTMDRILAAPSLLQERDRLALGDLVPLEPGEEARAAFFIEVVLTNDPDIDGQWDEALVPSVEAISEAVEEFFHRETRPWTARVSASPFAATSTATEEPTDD